MSLFQAHPVNQTEPQFFWPGDLNEIRTLVHEKNKILDFLKHNFEKFAFSGETSKVFSKHLEHTFNDKKWLLPISITFLYNQQGHVSHIVLMLNSRRGRVLGKGLQRSPKTCFDLLTRNFMVKKLVVEKEKELILKLQQKPCKHLLPILGTRTVIDKKGVCKFQFFEGLCEGTLTDWVGTPHLSLIEVKLNVIQNVILGLRALHHIQVSQEIEQSSKGAKVSKRYNHATCHLDVKPDNILVKDREAFLSDFGLANTIYTLAGSLAYMAPANLMKGLEKKVSEEEKASHRAQFGTKFDMWALGLIIVEVLLNRFSQENHLKTYRIPPLKFIETKLNPSSHLPNRGFITISQSEIDCELKDLKAKNSSGPQGYVMRSLWDLANSMLKIEPCLSITIDEAALEVSEIVSTGTHEEISKKINIIFEKIKNNLEKLINLSQIHFNQSMKKNYKLSHEKISGNVGLKELSRTCGLVNEMICTLKVEKVKKS